MSTVNGPVYQYITLSTSGAYTSPLIITSSGSVEGIYAPNTLSAQINNAGTVQAGLFFGRSGINLAGAGDVTNTGGIGGNISIGGNGYVGNNKDIAGTIVIGGTGYVVNSGTIGGSVTITGGGNIHNSGNAGGFVSGAGGVVTNTGTLGAALFETTGTVSNSAGAYIGVIDGPIAPMTNFGTIGSILAGTGNFTNAQSAKVNEIDFYASPATITNSGIVTDEIIMQGGSLTNAAGAQIYDEIDVSGGPVTILNYGSINNSLTDAAASGEVIMFGGGTFLNGQNAKVSGDVVSFQSASATNLGTITEAGILLDGGGSATNGSSGDTKALIDGYGYGILTGGTTAASVTNYGTLIGYGTRGAGVYLGAPGALTNDGTVTGAFAGVEVKGSITGTIDNYGSIGALGPGFGVGILVYGTANASLVNYGTLTGVGTSGVAIDVGSGTLQLSERPGAYIDGGVYGDGASTLILAGTKLDDIAGNILGFSQITDDSGSLGDLGGYDVMPSDGTITDNGDLVIAGTLTNDGAINETGTLAVTGTLIDYGTINGEVTFGTATTGGALSSDRIQGDGAVAFGTLEIGPNDRIGNAGTAVYGFFLPGSVINYGTINGLQGNSTTGVAISLQDGGSVKNGSSAAAAPLIQGYSDGIIIANGETASFINNYATIKVAGVFQTRGIGVLLSSNGQIENQATGQISGGGFGVRLQNGGGVVNAGTILWSGSTGTSFPSRAVTGYGAYFEKGGSVDNIGAGSELISGDDDGVKIQGGAGIVSNTGTIQAVATGTINNAYSDLQTSFANADGVYLKGSGGSVGNYGSAALISAYGYGVVITGGAGTVKNTGTIRTTGGDATLNRITTLNVKVAGVALGSGGYVENGSSATQSGLVTGVFSGGGTLTVNNYGTLTLGISSKAGPGTITNAGTAALIQGYVYNTGTSGTTTGTITNFGSIQGLVAAKGIVVNKPGASITNPSIRELQGGGSTIAGSLRAAAAITMYGGSVTNAGTISAGESPGLSVYGYTTETSVDGHTVSGFIRLSGVMFSAVNGPFGAGQVLNLGTIFAPIATGSSGVYLQEGGNVVNGTANDRSALIEGAAGIIFSNGQNINLPNPGIVSNYGTIIGGITLLGTGSVTNYGVIDGSNYLSSANIKNGTPGSTSAIISGGIRQAGNGALNLINYGIVTNFAHDSSIPSGTSGYIDIAGYLKNGSLSSTAASITFGTDRAGAAVRVGGSVTNFGSIQSTSKYTLVGEAGISNYGTISGGTAAAVYMTAGGDLTNGTGDSSSAQILGTGKGVTANADVGITNYGAIDGLGSYGIGLTAGGDLFNGTHGVISGYGRGVSIRGGTGTVTNYGAIQATGNNTVGVYVRNGGIIDNFGQISGSYAAVNLAGVQAKLIIEPGSQLTGRVANFRPGDTIDFADVPATQAAVANGILTLFNGTQVVDTLLINPHQVFLNAIFSVTSDDAGGSDVTLTQGVVSAGQILTVSAGQVVAGVTITTGGSEVVAAGGADNGAVLDGGSQSVFGSAANVVLDGNAVETVESGGVASFTTVSNTDTQTILGGGAASGSVVSSGGTEIVSAGSADTGAVLSGGGQSVFGTATSDTVGDGSTQTIEAGGVGGFTMVGNTGTQSILAGGAASGSVVSGGGFAIISAGGLAADPLLAGGTLVLSSGGATVGPVSATSAVGLVELLGNQALVAGTGGLTVSAGAGNDTVNALAGSDTVEAGAGTAIAFGASGDVVENGSGQAFVTLSGGTNPTIFSLSGGSALFYAGADDTLVAGGGTAVAIGAVGDDFVLGSGNDTVNVIPTGESITFGGGNAIVYGGPGDTIGDAAGTVVTFTSGGNAIVLAGSGNSVLLYSGPGDTLVGGNAAATVIGSANDEIVLGTGADTVNAFPANEVVELGTGANETIYGGAGDTIEAAGGSPIVTFESGSQGIVFVESAGSEQLYSGPGDDLVIGGGSLAVIGAAGDTLVLGSGTDTVNALPPNETVTLGTGTATVFGGDGDTIGDAAGTVVTFTGGNSAISVDGTSGAVTVSDGAGDTIAAGNAAATIAGAKNSSIVLGAANDTVTGANGNTITTGAGSDSIDFGASHSAAEFLAPGSGTDSGANDTVVNFSQTTGDRIVETGQAETNTLASASTSGGNTTFTLSDGSTVTLVGVSSINSNFFS